MRLSYHFDTQEYAAALEALCVELERIVDLQLQFPERLFELIERAYWPIEITLDRDCGSADASVRWVRLEASEALLELTAAARAFTRTFDLIFEGHAFESTGVDVRKEPALPSALGSTDCSPTRVIVEGDAVDPSADGRGGQT